MLGVAQLAWTAWTPRTRLQARAAAVARGRAGGGWGRSEYEPGEDGDPDEVDGDDSGSDAEVEEEDFDALLEDAPDDGLGADYGDTVVDDEAAYLTGASGATPASVAAPGGSNWRSC